MTLHDLMKHTNCKIQTYNVILDFSKAFDTVYHVKLKQREHRLVINGKRSIWVHVDYDIPQGTALGTIIFPNVY